MDTLFKISIGMLLTFVLITAITIKPVGAAAIQGTGDQVQKPEQNTQSSQATKNYGAKLSERNTAAKKISVGSKAVKPKQTGAAKDKNGAAKPQLSKHNQAVIDQAEAAKKKRALVDKNNAESIQK